LNFPFGAAPEQHHREPWPLLQVQNLIHGHDRQRGVVGVRVEHMDRDEVTHKTSTRENKKSETNFSAGENPESRIYPR